MTNLQRWLFYASLFAVPYLAICLGTVQTQFTTKYFLHIQLLPLVLLVIFGVSSMQITPGLWVIIIIIILLMQIFSVWTVLYRTFTFNDCPEAAKELQAEILEARKDLIAKGFRFRDWGVGILTPQVLCMLICNSIIYKKLRKLTWDRVLCL